MKEQKEKYVRMAKKMFDENNMDLWEMKIDVWMHKLMKYSYLEWFLSFSLVKSILASSFVVDIISKIRPMITKIFLVLGWVFVISGLIGVFSFLVQLTGIPFVFSFGVIVGIRVLLYILVAFAWSILSLLMGIASIRRKIWFPMLTVFGCGLSLLSLIITLIPSGFYESTSYGTFSSSLVNLLLSFGLFVLVIKNKDIFSA